MRCAIRLGQRVFRAIDADAGGGRVAEDDEAERPGAQVASRRPCDAVDVEAGMPGQEVELPEADDLEGDESGERADRRRDDPHQPDQPPLHDPSLSAPIC